MVTGNVAEEDAVENAVSVEAPTADSGSVARAERRRLEALHREAGPEAVEALWPGLASRDRFLRYAARIALEHQPVERWRARALAEADPRAAIPALLALARHRRVTD